MIILQHYSLLLDLSVYFYHVILPNRLCDRFGIKGTALDWFLSYLINRKQFVSIIDTTFLYKKLDFGVPLSGASSCSRPVCLKNRTPWQHSMKEQCSISFYMQMALNCICFLNYLLSNTGINRSKLFNRV